MRILNVLRILGGICCLGFSLGPMLFGFRNIGVYGLGLIGIYALIFPRLWRMLEKRALVRDTMVILTVFALIVIVVSSFVMLWQAYGKAPPESGSATVVVLGAGLNGTQPSLMLSRRLDAAIEYLNKNPDASCIVTGGQGADEVCTEASAMAGYMLDRGISPDRVIQEDKSTSTRENLAFAKNLLPKGHSEVIIATDAFHQFRASIYAGEQGMFAYSLPSKTPMGLLPAYWLREICGMPVAWVGVNGG